MRAHQAPAAAVRAADAAAALDPAEVTGYVLTPPDDADLLRPTGDDVLLTKRLAVNDQMSG
jgi:hypothetical protein